MLTRTPPPDRQPDRLWQGLSSPERGCLLAARESEFTVLAKTSNAEQWQVNVAVHFNSWDNLRKKDFAPVVKAFGDLLAGLTCSHCSRYLRVLPDRETPQLVCCECGKTNMNLRKKSA